VDAKDYEWLGQWNWQMRNGYAVRWKMRKLVFMHREIMQPPEGMIVDHKNLNRLDDTRDNLRVCTHVENARNRRKRRGTSSRFRGVSYNRRAKKWYAAIDFEGKPVYIGHFDDEVEVARAYDRKAVELFGEFARLNFPEEWPEERRREVREVAARPQVADFLV
jgi:hypothetical protein